MGQSVIYWPLCAKKLALTILPVKAAQHARMAGVKSLQQDVLIPIRVHHPKSVSKEAASNLNVTAPSLVRLQKHAKRTSVSIFHVALLSHVLPDISVIQGAVWSPSAAHRKRALHPKCARITSASSHQRRVVLLPLAPLASAVSLESVSIKTTAPNEKTVVTTNLVSKISVNPAQKTETAIVSRSAHKGSVPLLRNSSVNSAITLLSANTACPVWEMALENSTVGNFVIPSLRLQVARLAQDVLC